MARDYSKNQTYYEIQIHFKHGSKNYKVADKQRLDEFLKKTLNNPTIISYTVIQVSRMIYVEYEIDKHGKNIGREKKPNEVYLKNLKKLDAFAALGGDALPWSSTIKEGDLPF